MRQSVRGGLSFLAVALLWLTGSGQGRGQEAGSNPMAPFDREVEQLSKARRAADLLAKPADKRTPQEADELFTWWLGNNDARYKGLTGKLSALSPEVVKNQVLARVRFDGAQPKGLRQSQRVTARLLIEDKPNVVILPRGPFVESEGGKYAYVMRDGIAVKTPITLGATSVSAVEILSGVKPGDQVVIAGTDAFANAARVSIIK